MGPGATHGAFTASKRIMFFNMFELMKSQKPLFSNRESERTPMAAAAACEILAHLYVLLKCARILILIAVLLVGNCFASHSFQDMRLEQLLLLLHIYA